MKRSMIGGLAAVLMASTALAQTPPATGPARVTTSPPPVYGERLPPVRQMENITIELQPGTQGMVTLDQPYSQITLGSIEIADALPKSDTVIVVQGKKAGFTDMFIMRQDKLVQKVGIIVSPAPASRAPNRVFVHSPYQQGRAGNLQEYTSYECNPVCTRVADPFQRGTGNPEEKRPIIVVPSDFGQPGSGGIQTIQP